MISSRGARVLIEVIKREDRIPVAGPWVTDLEVSYTADAAANAWYGNANSYNQRFEDAFAQYTGTRHAVSLPSCTSAIHLSLAALGIGPGDEVILPDLTWIASAAPVTYVGATPVFVDTDEKTWCLDAFAFEAAIGERTRAVIPVDLYGSMPDFDAILEIARRHNIHVVEDAAEALGSEYKGRRAGSFGDTGVFSFHGSKTLTTGEGGMLVTDDTALHQRVLFLHDHGRKPGDRMFRNQEIAFKYKMSAFQAAFGLAQLERVDELIQRKREIFSWYRKHLGQIPEIALNFEPAGTKNSYWMVTVVLDPSLALGKEEVMAKLDGWNIDSRPFFSPLSSLKPYRDSCPSAAAKHPVSYRLAASGVNLPSGYNLTEDDVGYVCAVMKDIVAQAPGSKA
jgi:perosamine synthetase